MLQQYQCRLDGKKMISVLKLQPKKKSFKLMFSGMDFFVAVGMKKDVVISQNASTSIT
jgi:hypothetical protein